MPPHGNDPDSNTDTAKPSWNSSPLTQATWFRALEEYTMQDKRFLQLIEHGTIMDRNNRTAPRACM